MAEKQKAFWWGFRHGASLLFAPTRYACVLAVGVLIGLLLAG